MPIYEYVCKACGHELESLQYLSEDPLTDCPECKESALRRKISASGFRLGGKGWYETDFKSADKQRNLAGDREPVKSKDKKDDKGDKKSDKKAESKPAPATKAKSTSSSD